MCKCGHHEFSHYAGKCMGYISPTDQTRLCECRKFRPETDGEKNAGKEGQ